jgi:hypothetical protein
MNTDYNQQKWNRRNTMMTIANLAADLANRAPSPYELLQRIGLERRRSRTRRVAARAGWIGVGMAFGSGLAMLFTPRSGREVREQLGERAKRARDYVAPGEAGDEPGARTAQQPPSAREPRRRV